MFRLVRAARFPCSLTLVKPTTVTIRNGPMRAISALTRHSSFSDVEEIHVGRLRSFTSTAAALSEKVNIVFVETDGTRKEVSAEVGQSILDAAHEHDIDLEGACEGTLACSTCHVIVEDDAFFKKLPAPEEEEMDMLDLAIGLEDKYGERGIFDLADASKENCMKVADKAIVLNKDLEGIVLRLPKDTLDRRGKAE